MADFLKKLKEQDYIKKLKEQDHMKDFGKTIEDDWEKFGSYHDYLEDFNKTKEEAVMIELRKKHDIDFRGMGEIERLVNTFFPAKYDLDTIDALKVRISLLATMAEQSKRITIYKKSRESRKLLLTTLTDYCPPNKCSNPACLVNIVRENFNQKLHDNSIPENQELADSYQNSAFYIQEAVHPHNETQWGFLDTEAKEHNEAMRDFWDEQRHQYDPYFGRTSDSDSS